MVYYCLLSCKLALVAGLGAIGIGSNSLPSLAQPIPVAQHTDRTPETVTGELTPNSLVLQGDGSYYETHTFEGSAGETLTFDLISNDFDGYLILMNPAGEQIAGDDDGAGGTNARITLRLPTTGTYTLIVNSYGAGKTGTYRLETRTATAEEQALSALAKVNQLNQQAVELYQAADFASAIPLVEQALAISEQELGPEHTFTALSLSNLASLYMDVGRYEEAESLLKRGLAISEQVLGPEHPNVVASLSIVVTPKIRTGLRERKLESNRGKEYGQQTQKLQ